MQGEEGTFFADNSGNMHRRFFFANYAGDYFDCDIYVSSCFEEESATAKTHIIHHNSLKIIIFRNSTLLFIHPDPRSTYLSPCQPHVM